MNTTHRSSTTLRSLLLLLIALCFNNNTMAHIAIENTTPAADETVKTAPSELVLEFMHPVILTTLTLVDDAKGANININFKAGSDLANKFMLPLPTLGNGHYTVNWTATGRNGHNKTDSYSFTVNVTPINKPTEKTADTKRDAVKK